eukprot:1193881-Prorocentrum_minimum.AAC.3
MPGRLIHTNEILVHIGDAYYAERSSSQALDTLARGGPRAPKFDSLHDWGSETPRVGLRIT